MAEGLELLALGSGPLAIDYRLAINPPVDKIWDVLSLLIEDHAQELSPRSFHLLFGAEGNRPLGLAGLDDQDHAIDLSAEDPALWRAVDRRRVQDNEIVAVPHLLQKLVKPIGFKKDNGLRMVPTVRNDVKVPRSHLDWGGPTTTFGHTVREAVDVVDSEYAVEAGTPQIYID